MANDNQKQLEGALASLSSEALDQLAQLVAAKLTAKNGGCLLHTQEVTGSSPVSPTLDRKGALASQARGNKMSVDSLLTRYSLAARAEGLSPKTVGHIKRVVGFFDNFMGGITNVKEVTADDLKRFIVALQDKTKWSGTLQANGKHLSGTSINTYVRGVKSFWGWLLREKIIKTNPLASVPAPKIPKRLPKVLAEDDLIRVLKVASGDDRDRALLSLLLDSGIRLSELTGLTPDDVGNDGRVKVFGKGSKERYVFINEKTRLAITMYYCDSRPEPVANNRLFLTFDGYPLTNNRVQKILERIGKKAGISQRLSPHKLRHSFATLSLRYGCNLEFLRRELGHTDIKTTEVYLGLTDADVAEAHKQSSPMANLLLKRAKRG